MVEKHLIDIIKNSELIPSKKNENIFLYDKNTLDNLRSILNTKDISEKEKIDILKKIIIENILLKDNIEKYYNNIVITQNEIIIHIDDIRKGKLEKRFEWMEEIEIYYRIVNELFKEQFEKMAKEIAEDIYKMMITKRKWEVSNNEFFAKNFVNFTINRYNSKISEKIQNIDPAVLLWLSWFIFRSYFDKILYYISEILLNKLIDWKIEAENFLNFYWSTTEYNWKKTKIKAIKIDNKKVNTTIIRSILLQRKSILYLMEKEKSNIDNTIKRIKKLEKEKSYILSEIKYLEESILNIVWKHKIIKLQYIINNIRNTIKASKFKNSKDKKEKLEKRLEINISKYNELYDKLDKEQKNEIDNYIIRLNQYKESLDILKKRLLTKEEEIKTKKSLLESNNKKLQQLKKSDIEIKFDKLLKSISDCMIKPV